MSDVFADVRAELERAERLFPPMRSPHEAWAIIDEEAEELKREVYHGVPAHRMERMREEAVQLAAMAIRLVRDICDK